MPRVDIPVQTTSRTATTIGSAGAEVAGDASNDHDFLNNGHTLLVVRNSSVTTRTVEVVIQSTVDGVTPAVKSYSITNALHTVIGPFPPGIYNTAGGRCQVNVDHAEVKFQAISIGS